MRASYDPLLVVLSVVVAIAAGYVALDLAGRVTVARGRIRAAWLAGGALALGTGIWSMHFIGMLAFRLSAGPAHPPVAMLYDVPRLVLSMAVAVGASLLALALVSRERLRWTHHLAASVALGAAIAGMHYVGMAGLHVPASLRYDRGWVVASIGIAIGASAAALWLLFRLRREESNAGHLQRLGAAVLIGVAIAGMHYTAMGAARFGAHPAPVGGGEGAVLATSGLGWAVSGATLLILTLAVIGSAVDRALRERLAMTEEIQRLYEHTEAANEELQAQAMELELQIDAGRELASELEAVNARLQRALEDAEQASRAKSAFLATMSHELRTPLNAFAGYLQLMEMGVAGPVTPAQQGYIDRLQSSSRHLTGLINDVLDLAKIESGNLVVRTGAVHLSDVMQDALTLVQPQLEAKGLTVSEQCDMDPHAWFAGDEDRVRQILVNLISNAVKYNMPGGSVALDCGTTDAPDPEARLAGAELWAFVRVRDTGVGIAADQLDAVFEPFTQLDSGLARKAGGTGLGLTISRRLARQMGGELTVRSTPGSGSVFTLWLRGSSVARGSERPALEAARRHAADTGAVPRVQGLAGLGRAVLREIPGVIQTYVERMRRDPAITGAAPIRYSQLADHYAALLADIGVTLIALDETSGAPSPLFVDSTDIQRFVSSLHGAQRIELGWSEAAVRREHEILREEVARVVSRAPHGQEEAYEAAHQLVRRFIEQAEENAVRAMRASLEARGAHAAGSSAG